MTSMQSQTHKNFVLYVVDNASADNTIARLHDYDDNRVVLIRNNENMGVAFGNNQGIKASLADRCEYVLLINNDTVFGCDLLQVLLDGLDKYKCDVIVPKILYNDEPERIWFVGGYFNKLKFYYNVHIGFNQIDHGQYNDIMTIEYAPTCCMLLKSSVFSKVGLMDERYFVYFDDVDFCFNVVRDGFVMKVLPKATLYHKVSTSTGGQYSDFSIKYGMRNRVYFLTKYFPRLKILIVLYMFASAAKQLCLRCYTFRQFALAIKSVIEGYKMLESTNR
jgi:GT2 family glycosyltransferase